MWGKLQPALLLAALAALHPALAQTADELFDDRVLHDVHLYIHPSDWRALKLHYTENTYYPADFSWRGSTVETVGIRSRGLGSRTGIKPGLRVDFNRYTKGQEFLGLRALVLDNVYQDPAFLREYLSMHVFRRMGLPAPREAFARLYVNDQYAGLYVLVEEINKDFLKRNFDQDDGYLYEYKWLTEYRFERLGDQPEDYLDKFQPVTHERDPEMGPLVELIRLANRASDQEFAARIPEFLDPNLFVVHLAVENFLAEWDGIVGYAGMNNFYIYRFEESNRFQFIPWDKDVTLSEPEHPINYNLDQNVLVRRLLALPEILPAYLNALDAVAGVSDTDHWLTGELERAYALFRGAALADPFKPSDNAGFEGSIQAVRDFVLVRAGFVLGELQKLRGQTP